MASQSCSSRPRWVVVVTQVHFKGKVGAGPCLVSPRQAEGKRQGDFLEMGWDALVDSFGFLNWKQGQKLGLLARYKILGKTVDCKPQYLKGLKERKGQ